MVLIRMLQPLAGVLYMQEPHSMLLSGLNSKATGESGNSA